ncbi:uncharacterized protein UTRI_00323_B [Ustilago trichophora]|uniref:DUF1783-domain-containing protein n=1 Tax=Ustilago trichophora TaxID=86804 RepID=A0A5C3DNY1_9BASI|nr:uncharacterized protein UTRI_00323_B [Ustilago trichophora]
MLSSVRTSIVRVGGATSVSSFVASIRPPASTSIGSGLLRRQLLHSGSVRRFPSFTPPPPSSVPASSSVATSTPSKTNSGIPPSSTGSNIGRPTQVRTKPLPQVPNTLPYLVIFITLALTSWAGFTVYATNKEKLSSSILKSVVSQVKNSPEVRTLLSPPSISSDGQNQVVPVLKREAWLGGMCRVKGSVNMMQGRVDLSFKIQSPIDEDQIATVYFTSIRAHKHAPFEILRFLVVNQNTGQSVSLLEKSGLSSIDVDSGDIV